MSTLRLYSIAYPVTALGPGMRVALWVSGCPLRCPGCITPELWNPAAGHAVAVDDVLARLLALDIDLDGITLTGGEPFEQAAALAELIDTLSDARPHWNVLCFSGYSMRELSRKPTPVGVLLSRIDVLIAGRYVAKRPSAQPLVASTNQHRHYLTPRGRRLRRRFETLDATAANLAVGSAGQKLLVGVLDPATRATIHSTLGTYRDHREETDA